MSKLRNFAVAASLAAVAATPALATATTLSSADKAQDTAIDSGFFKFPHAGDSQPLAGEGLDAEAKTSDLIPAEDESGDATISVTISVDKGEFTLSNDSVQITSVKDGKAVGASDSAVLRDAKTGQKIGDLKDTKTISAGESVRAVFHIPGGDADFDDAENNVVVLNDSEGNPVASWDLH